MDYRIVDRHGSISVWPAEIFEIIDNRVPESWSVFSDFGNTVTIGYGEFARIGFWEDFYDDSVEAMNVVARVLNELRPLPPESVE